MSPKWCRLCGAFLINPEKQIDPDEMDVLPFVPLDYKYFAIFLVGMILGAIIGSL